MKSRRIQLATGLGYHVLEWDGPEDTTFVLVHGFSDLAAGWCEVAPLLAARGRVIAPDLRGHGDSDRVGAGGYYHFFDYVADLDDVVRQLAGQRVVLVGHSMGGSVCGYYAGIRPDRLARLVLLEGLGPPDLMGGEGPTRTGSWIDAWRVGLAPNRAKVMTSIDDAAQRLIHHDHLLDPALAKKLAELGTREVPGGLSWKHDPLHMTVGPYAFRLELALKHWERITCPVLIVDGGKSRMNLAEDDRAARRAHFANHRHLVLEEAGHAMQRHQPQRLADEILAHAA